MRVAGTTVSREDLVRNVLGRDFSPFDRSIDTHVCNLRRKLGRWAKAESASREFAAPATFMHRRRNRRHGEKTLFDDFPVVLAPDSCLGAAPCGRAHAYGYSIHGWGPAGVPRSHAFHPDGRGVLLLHQPVSDQAACEVGRGGGEDCRRAPGYARRSLAESAPRRDRRPGSQLRSHGGADRSVDYRATQIARRCLARVALAPIAADRGVRSCEAMCEARSRRRSRGEPGPYRAGGAQAGHAHRSIAGADTDR